MTFKQIISTILISLFVSWVSFTFLFDHGGAVITAKKQESVYDRVMRTKTIRCGYYVRPAILMKDINSGKLSGIAFDLMEQIGQKLSLKIEWTEETSPGEYPAGLAHSRFDLFCSPGWISAQRARIITFTDPVIYERSVVFVRTDNQIFDGNIQALNDSKYTMAMIDGTTPFYLANIAFPKAKKISLPEGSPLNQGMLDVAAGKADATLFAELEGIMYMKANPDKLRIVPHSEVSIVPTALGLKRGEEEFRQMLNNTLLDLQAQGITDKIITKYEPVPNLFLRAASGYRSE